MGKMLDALKRMEEQHSPTAELKPLLRSYRPELDSQPEAASEENSQEIPFIEVGGPGTPLEASPLVLPGTGGPSILRAHRADPQRGPRMPAFAVPVVGPGG